MVQGDGMKAFVEYRIGRARPKRRIAGSDVRRDPLSGELLEKTNGNKG